MAVGSVQRTAPKKARALPKYAGLKNELLTQLTTGRLKPGTALPSEQELAIGWGVARTTVRQALAELESEGLIDRVRGKGTFVRQDAQRQVAGDAATFALVVPETQTALYPSLLHGFEDGALKMNSQTMVCITRNELGQQVDALMRLLDRMPAGVAIVPVTDPPTPLYHVRPLRDRGIPIVFCHRRVEGFAAPLIAHPFSLIGRTGAEACLRHGHRRIACFGLVRGGPAAQAWKNSIRETVEAGGGELPDEFIYQGQSISPDPVEQEDAVRQALKQMLSAPSPPTAILASFDSMAELIYHVLRDMGVDVPGQVSLVGWGGAWRQGPVVRRLTSVTIDEVQLGIQAAELLSEMQSGKRPLDNNDEIILPVNFYQGQTLAQVSKNVRGQFVSVN